MVQVSDKRKSKVYLSIGSNIGDRMKNLKDALKQITLKVGKIEDQSSFFETEGWGATHLKSFYNMAVTIQTDLGPFETLKCCLEIETKMGRIRDSEGYVDRVIDIDLLFFDDLMIDSVDLMLPHPRIQERNFVLYPLAEIAPNLIHSKLGKSIIHLKKESLDANQIEKLS